nr:MAG TPA: Major head protein [Caudoviricetes sp.]
MNKKKVPFYIRFIANTDAVGGSEQSDTDSQQTVENDSTNGTENSKQESKQSETSKEFSRALNKRVEEVEAKYANYDELKEKAEKYDSQESANAQLIEKLQAENDALKAKAEHNAQVEKLAHETELDVQLISLLKGDGKELEENAAILAKFFKAREHNLPTAGTKSSVPPSVKMTPFERIAAAFSN